MDIATPSSVRIAGPEDEEELLRMCAANHAERCVRGWQFKFSEDRARATIHRAIIPHRNEPDLAWCGVIGETGDTLKGSVYLSVQTPFDSDEQYLSNRWNWVYPEYRKSDTQRLLFAFASAVATELKMRIIGDVVSIEDDSPQLRFFRRNGCKTLGSMYIFDSEGAR